MKYFIYFLIISCISLIAFNFTQVNLDNLVSQGNTISLIGIIAPLCAILLLTILLQAQRVKKRLDK